MTAILTLLALSVFCSVEAKKHTFADVFKPLSLTYLYNLFDTDKTHQKALNDMFKVVKKINIKKKKHKKVLAYSLFWKAPFVNDKQPLVSERTLYSNDLSIKRGESFYRMYAKPLLDQLAVAKEFYPGWIPRVYLAHDLAFLIPELTTVDAEVFLMKSNSIAASPGAMWRFMVFDDPDVEAAYVRDADWSPDRLDGKFQHTNLVLNWVADKKNKGFFRLRDFNFVANVFLPRYKNYSPIIACAFGAKKVSWINMEKAMKGFILHRMLYADERRHPGDIPFEKHPYGFGNEFPNYGFDERFLKHVVYFEAAHRGELALLSTGYLRNNGTNLPHDNWVRLDLEYIDDHS